MVGTAIRLGVVLSGMLMKPRREQASNEMRNDERTGQWVVIIFLRRKDHHNKLP